MVMTRDEVLEPYAEWRSEKLLNIPQCPGQLSQPQDKITQAQSVNSAKTEKPCSRGLPSP